MSSGDAAKPLCDGIVLDLLWMRPSGIVRTRVLPRGMAPCLQRLDPSIEEYL